MPSIVVCQVKQPAAMLASHVGPRPSCSASGIAFCSRVWKSSRSGLTQVLVPQPAQGDPDRVLYAWFQPDPTSAVAAIFRVNQQLFFFSCLYLSLSLSLSNK